METKSGYILAKGDERPIQYANHGTFNASPLALDFPDIMGIGLLHEDRVLGFRGSMTKKVLTCYRGVRVAEKLYKFTDETFSDCWFAGQRNVPPCGKASIDAVEKVIGKAERHKILNMVPENLDAILTELQRRKTKIDVSELDDDVKLGVMKASRLVQKYLDDYHREQGFVDQERYGRIVSPDVVKTEIKAIQGIGDVGIRFLDAYDRSTVRNGEKGIAYSDSNRMECLLISKHKDTDKIEVTLRGGYRVSLWPSGVIPDLAIYLKYDGNDIDFTPKVPKRGFFQRLKLWKPREPTESENFPLLDAEYGAIIRPYGELMDPVTSITVGDDALSEVVRAIYKDLESTRMSF